LGKIVCSANWLLYWLGTCVNFILNSEGSLALAVPVGCLPHTFLQSLQECSQLFEELKGGAAFTGLVAGRHLHMHPYFVSCLYFSDSVAVLAGHLCEFHTEQ
jgi:hypothetical protein